MRQAKVGSTRNNTALVELRFVRKSTLVDQKATVSAWTLSLFATRVNLRADLRIRLATHRKSACKFWFCKLASTCDYPELYVSISSWKLPTSEKFQTKIITLQIPRNSFFRLDIRRRSDLRARILHGRRLHHSVRLSFVPGTFLTSAGSESRMVWTLQHSFYRLESFKKADFRYSTG